MARTTIDYGIDLGTTNSAICRMEKGEPKITKSDMLKDTMPSCVSVNKKGSIRVGDGAYNTMKQDKRRATKSWRAEASNTYVEFKRTMGTDKKYSCANAGRAFTSEELSAEVLKALKSFVLDDTINAAVVTVPAKFTVNQKTATLEAAKLAGIQCCRLLQEPIAASMAYGLTSDEKTGTWMVFDFGGGTFDAALIRVEDGIMQVFDTEGDNYLGGKNLDYAIVDGIIIPYLEDSFAISGILGNDGKKQILRDAMKTYAEEAKNHLSFNEKFDIGSILGDLGEDDDGEELELDLTVTREQVFAVMRPHFQKAVDICKELLQRNGLAGTNLTKLILVGGPTHCPLIRQMLREQITENVDTSIDPMTAVAVGAALFASTQPVDAGTQAPVAAGTLRLELAFDATTAEKEEWVTVKLPADSEKESVLVEFVRGDGYWSSGRIEVDRNGNVVGVQLLESRPNVFEIRAYDASGNALPCEPHEITILQGLKVGAAVLPYNIGIAVLDTERNKHVFEPAPGLEKNKPLPAVGQVNDKRTTGQLRPGVAADRLVIPVYQTDDLTEAAGRLAELFEYVANVVITGDDVDALVPADTYCDVTLKVDSSEQMTMTVDFHLANGNDISAEKMLDTSKKQSLEEAKRLIPKNLAEAQKGINKLRDEGVPVDDLQKELDFVKADANNNNEPKQILQNTKEILRKIDEKDRATEWDRLEKQIREELANLERAQRELGTPETAEKVARLRNEVDSCARERNVRLGREVLEQISQLYFKLTLLFQFAGFIRHYNTRFSSVRWRDYSRARELVNRGMSEIRSGEPTVETLRPIVRGIIELLPPEEAQNADAGGLLK